ncbi:MAG: DUF4035 domain-containing protein [Microbispora sp.]|nr:DUF4035 domain-containing protein [Microbispora sp.]
MVFGPVGPARDDILAALISAHVVSALSSSKTRRLKLSDFLPQWGVVREEVDGRGDDQEPPHPVGR